MGGRAGDIPLPRAGCPPNSNASAVVGTPHRMAVNILYSKEKINTWKDNNINSIKEMQIKPTIIYHYAHFRLVKRKSGDIRNISNLTCPK